MSGRGRRPPGGAVPRPRTADDRDRQGVGAPPGRADPRRADLLARPRRGGAGARPGPRGTPGPAARCCSSGTGWTRCGRWPTGWSCCAAAGWWRTWRPREATEERMIREMVGSELAHADLAPPSSVERTTVLSVRGLTADGLGPVDLDVRAGEIVGVAGLMGSGRSRLLHTVMGAQPRTGGSVAFDGADFRPRHPADAVEAGIGLVPEDRKVQSLLPAHSVRWNVTLTTLRRISTRGRAAAARRQGARPPDRRGPRGAAAQPGAADQRPVGRQPAEGRLRPLAGRRAPGCCCSTSRPAAWTSAPRPRSTASSTQPRRTASRSWWPPPNWRSCCGSATASW